MKNEWGFGLLNILFLIPIIFAFGMLIISSHQMISKYTDIQRECRSHVLEAQQILGKNLRDLIDLNPQAKALRTEEAALRAALIPARAFPPVAAALQAKLNFNIFQQQLLRGRQELLISSAIIRAQRTLMKLPLKIKSARYSAADLKVYKTPPNAIAPDHKTIPLFKEAQTIKVSWRLPIQEFVPQILLDVFKDTQYPSTVEGRCAATLIQKGEAWNPKLHLARF